MYTIYEVVGKQGDRVYGPEGYYHLRQSFFYKTLKVIVFCGNREYQAIAGKEKEYGCKKDAAVVEDRDGTFVHHPVGGDALGEMMQDYGKAGKAPDHLSLFF